MERFRNICRKVSCAIGSPWAFIGAFVGVAIWLISGPVFHYSDTWQLVINTSTTIVTFLMVFVIQNAQNRDSKAVHIKLDELLRAMKGASNRFVVAENQTEEEQDREIAELVDVARREAGTPEAARALEHVEKAKGGRTQRNPARSSGSSKTG